MTSKTNLGRPLRKIDLLKKSSALTSGKKMWVAVCGCVLQCGAVCSCVLLCVAMCCSVLRCVAVCCNLLQCVAVCWNVLQCVAMCCSDVIHV